MKDTEQRGYEMLLRSDEYGTARATVFSPESAGGLLFASLHTEIGIIEDTAGKQSSGFSAKEEGTAMRAIARENLRNQMEAMRRTAVSLALTGTMPGLENRFRMPRSNNDQLLINTARAFAQDATPLAASFISYGLAQSFLADLNTAITEFEQAINKQNAARDTHVTATTAIDEALERGINIVRQLDAIVRNKYADDAPQLAAWESASHIERSPQRSEQTTPQPTTPPKP
jgi:hypothetical protein